MKDEGAVLELLDVNQSTPWYAQGNYSTDSYAEFWPLQEDVEQGKDSFDG